MQLLSRLNKIAIATGQSPDDLLNTVITTIENSLVQPDPGFSVDASISTANTPRKRRPNRGWSPAAKRAHSVRMKEIYRLKKEAQMKKKPGVKELTPEHKTKLMAGLARWRMHKKLDGQLGLLND